MIREYKIIVNGSQLANDSGKLQVNSNTDVRRCLVNGVDVIGNFAQLKMQLNFNARVTAFSTYTGGCVTTDESGFSGWSISNLTLSSLTNDFTILSANFRLSIADTSDPYGHSGASIFYLDSPNRSFTSFPLTMNNVTSQSWQYTGSSTNEMTWYLFAKFNTLNIRYEPTGEVFNISNKAFLLQTGEIDNPSYNWNWTESLTFNVSKELLIEEAVSQY